MRETERHTETERQSGTETESKKQTESQRERGEEGKWRGEGEGKGDTGSAPWSTLRHTPWPSIISQGISEHFTACRLSLRKPQADPAGPPTGEGLGRVSLTFQGP